METVNAGIEAISRRIIELHGEVDTFKSIISVNRKHITHAHRRIRILERGVKMMEKGNIIEAQQVFEKEMFIHSEILK